MSFYIKLLVIVILGSFVARFLVYGLVVSTDHMPDTFSAGGGDRLEHRRIKQMLAAEELDKRLAKAAEDNLEANKPKERATDAENNRVQGGAAEQQDYAAVPEPQPVPVVEEEQSPELEEVAILAPVPASDTGELMPNVSAPQSAGSGGQSTRADSDADMKKPATASKQNSKPDNRIDRSTYEKNKTDIKKRVESVQAVDLAYAPPDNGVCTIPGDEVVRVGVHYRKSSFAIKGQSLTSIDQLIKLYKKCGGGTMLVLQNPEGLEDSEERLIQLRQDEVKYYLLQRRIPKDDMIFADNL